MTSPMPDAVVHVIETNGIRMHVAELGSGPLVVFAHGWPDSWLSWRHQMRAVAGSGYRAVAVEMRGYGETDSPADVGSFDLRHLADDIAGVIEHFGGGPAHLVGHDWGAMVAAGVAQFHPERLSSLTLLSVPFAPRTDVPPLEVFAELFGDAFFYITYHNEPGGVAEAEYDADPRGLLRRLHASPDAPRATPEVEDPRRSAGGWIPRLGEPLATPAWLSDDEFDYLVSRFEIAGFRGGVNYYRNMDRNWELTADTTAPVPMPTLFLAGDQDMVVMGRSVDDLRSTMEQTCADLRDVVLVPGPGHWVQQEAPEAVNEVLLGFLHGVDDG
ncbi:MAG: alpha/beta hydrolase [Actinomycetota bacterium]